MGGSTKYKVKTSKIVCVFVLDKYTFVESVLESMIKPFPYLTNCDWLIVDSLNFVLSNDPTMWHLII